MPRRRPHSDQTSFAGLLDHAPSAVPPDQDAMVRAYIANILPRGVPTYVRRVLAVRAYDKGSSFWGKAKGFEADIEVFDGRCVTVRISGRLGEAGYSWRFPAGDEGFHWDARREAWVRLPKGWTAKAQAA